MSIVLDHVSLSYGDKQILSDIQTTIEAGKITCILGENGSGKTTLLRCISGLNSCKGEVSVDEKPLKTYKRKDLSKKIAVLNQFSSAYFSYTVWETIMLGRYSHQNGFLAGASAEDTEIVEENLKRFGLSELKDRRIDTLSGGQLQRVFLAQTFAQDADYLLLDEPMNHLDLRYRAQLLEQLKAYPKTVIAVFHDIPTAIHLAGHILLLKDGKILYSGIPEGLLESSILTEAFHIDVKAYYRNLNLS